MAGAIGEKSLTVMGIPKEHRGKNMKGRNFGFKDMGTLKKSSVKAIKKVLLTPCLKDPFI